MTARCALRENAWRVTRGVGAESAAQKRQTALSFARQRLSPAWWSIAAVEGAEAYRTFKWRTSSEGAQFG